MINVLKFDQFLPYVSMYDVSMERIYLVKWPRLRQACRVCHGFRSRCNIRRLISPVYFCSKPLILGSVGAPRTSLAGLPSSATALPYANLDKE